MKMNGKHQLTKEGFENHKQELERLKSEDRIRNLEDLKEARSQGDLSENADYDAARETQARIEKRIKELEEIIKNAIIINGSSRSNLGKTIEIEFESSKFVDKYTLVGSLEADPEKKKISNESPLGLSILHAKAGDRVFVKTDSNEFSVLVKSIE